MMLSIKDLQYYCRTCLVKLENCYDDSSKSIATKAHPELQHLIQVCLTRATAGNDSTCLYAPFLCRSCFEKWSDFLKLYQLAVHTDAKIRKILDKEALKSEAKEDDDILRTVESEDYRNNDIVNLIEKYETSTPFLADSELNKYQLAIQIDSDTNHKVGGVEGGLEEICDDPSNDCSFSSSNSYTDETNTLKNDLKRTKKNKNTSKSKSVVKRKYKTSKSALKSSAESETSRSIVNKNTDENDRQHVLRKIHYKCVQCNKYFWEKKKFEGHMKQVHEGIKKPYQCNQCDKAYNLYKTLLQHKRDYHSQKGQEAFKCDQCSKVFKTAVILKQHVTNKHSAKKEAMRSICDQCGFIAAHQYSLARHIINKHTETDQIKCDQCPKVFKTRYSLKYHILGNHNPLNIKPFKCSECEMGFTRKTLLNQHKRTHLKYTERIKCDFEGCEIRFVKHGDKTHHMRLVHLKVKQHICDFCGEAFGAMQTLRHHRFIHTGEKPYKCNVCGQGFRQRTAMKTHRKTHFGKELESQENVLNNLPEVNLSLVND